jgi:hypothetical protein
MKSFISSEDDKVYNTPEKWFIRELWAKFALNRKKKNKKQYIRLLTLTSIKAYDIILLCEKGLIQTTETGYSPESVAFCERDPERYTRIYNTLPGAKAYQGTFEDFVGAGDIGYTDRARKWFPFDVVNLDFSCPMFKHRGRKTSRLIEAILKMFMIQSFKKQSFSLFLSVPAVKKWDDEEGRKQLSDCLKVNLRGKETTKFREVFKQKYPKKIDGYYKFLLVAVPKLIIKYGQSQTFDVDCLGRYTYIGETARTKMVSFMFDCEYQGLPDGYGGENPTSILAKVYPERVLKIIEKDYVDINKEFDEQPDVKKKYVARKKKYA